MKNAFSLIELIVAIVIVGLLAGIGLPKLMNTKKSAQVISIKKDITTIVSSIQTSFLMDNEVENINDIVTLNTAIWNVNNATAVFEDSGKSCITILIDSESSIISLDIDENVSSTCQELANKGVIDTTYNLY